jgi:hypothetical protein
LKDSSLKVRSGDSAAEGRIGLRLELSRRKLYIFDFKFKKYPSKSKTGARSGAETKPKKARTKGEIKAGLMAAAINEAKTRITEKEQAGRYSLEFAEAHLVAAGIVGRSSVRAELV